MSRLAILAVFIPLLCAAAEPPILARIENRYNHAQSLKMAFNEVDSGGRRPSQTESGELYLRKPGKMRWEYTNPAGKLYLSDGKEVYLYTPDDHRAEKSKLKQSEDMRAPMAFLLGKLDFSKEFRSFEIRGQGDDSLVTATPKSDNLAYTKVEFLASPDGQIHQVRVTGQDQSKLEFTFSDEQLNVPVAESQFVFHAPPGVEVVEATE